MSSLSLLVQSAEGGWLDVWRNPEFAGPLLQAFRREGYLAFWAVVLAPLGVLWVRVVSRRWGHLSLSGILAHVAAIALLSICMWSQIVVLSCLLGWDQFPESRTELGNSFRQLFIGRIPADALLYGLVAFWTVSRDAGQRVAAEQLHARELAADLSEARLEALQARLQPHFLYNTLHTIDSFVEEDPKAARRMLTKLADLLRATLREASTLLPLSRELEILDAFLEIQRIRFGARLEIEYQIEPGLEGALVPPLVLQPLAENAVRHALDRQDRAGLVRVAVSRLGERLVLEVTDNGDEFRPGRRDNGGVGLSTTRARLEQLYPGQARLDLQRRPGRTLVSIEVPLRMTTPGATP